MIAMNNPTPEQVDVDWLNWLGIPWIGIPGEHNARKAQMWYCPTCDCYVDGVDVTFDERHDKHAGDCGLKLT